MSGAEQVLSILANAVKHKDVLTQEVEALKKSNDALKGQEAKSKAAITANDASAKEAQALALEKIAKAQQQASDQVAEIMASVQERTQAAISAFEAKQADLAGQIEALNTTHLSNIVQAQIKEAELNKAILQLEEKLDKVKAQAKKFADTLAG